MAAVLLRRPVRGLRQRPPRGRARWSANPWPPLRVWPVRACPPPCASRRFAVLPRRPPCAARIPVGGGQPPWTIAARGRQLHHRRSLPYARRKLVSVSVARVGQSPP